MPQFRSLLIAAKTRSIYNSTMPKEKRIYARHLLHINMAVELVGIVRAGVEGWGSPVLAF